MPKFWIEKKIDMTFTRFLSADLTFLAKCLLPELYNLLQLGYCLNTILDTFRDLKWSIICLSSISGSTSYNLLAKTKLGLGKKTLSEQLCKDNTFLPILFENLEFISDLLKDELILANLCLLEPVSFDYRRAWNRIINFSLSGRPQKKPESRRSMQTSFVLNTLLSKKYHPSLAEKITIYFAISRCQNFKIFLKNSNFFT